MITLSKKAKKSPAETVRTTNNNICMSRISVRDKLLVKEVQEMEANMPATCKVKFDDPNTLCHFEVLVSPDEGFWSGGKFHFAIDIPEEYNMVPPQVKCLTRIWHPNIAEEGDICLSLLRQNSIDGLGWAPTRTLKDLIWGLNSLFTDLLNFDDPLNIEAAEHYQKDRDGFRTRVREYINMFAKR